MSDGTLTQLIWRKSSFSAANGGTEQCVEVAHTPDLVALRDSKNPSSPVLTFPAAEWATFLSALRTGEFDL